MLIVLHELIVQYGVLVEYHIDSPFDTSLYPFYHASLDTRSREREPRRHNKRALPPRVPRTVLRTFESPFFFVSFFRRPIFDIAHSAKAQLGQVNV